MPATVGLPATVGSGRRDRPLKVCFVTTNFPRYLGDGEGSFIWAAAKAVADHGHQVRVVAQHWPGLPVRQQVAGIDIFRPRYWWPESGEGLRQEGGGLPIVWREKPWLRLQILPFAAVHTLAVARFARDCDLIHAQWTLSAGAAWLSKLVHHRPILATLQGSDIFQVTRNPLGARLTRLVLQRCDRITVLSQALAQATTAIGIPPAAIRVVPNGVDISQFTPPAGSREPILLYVGSLITRKGVIYLLQAFAQLVPRHPALRLVIAGDGPERDTLERVCQQLGVQKRVDFVGMQSQAQVRERMQTARLFILPSLEEGLGVVLLEALACGTPIVGSRVGGIPDVVTPTVGRLVPPANSQALAGAIDELLADETTWQNLSRQARERVEQHYDWRQIAARFIEIYDEMLENRAGG